MRNEVSNFFLSLKFKYGLKIHGAGAVDWVLALHFKGRMLEFRSHRPKSLKQKMQLYCQTFVTGVVVKPSIGQKLQSFTSNAD